MAVIQRSEFTLALNQISSERGVDPAVVLATIKEAILAAYRKDHPDVEPTEFEVGLDERSGETRIIHKGADVTPPGFGRIAAQTAKQVLLQKIREKEKDAILDEYSRRVGTVVNGMILRFAGPNVIVDIGKSEAVMLPSHKIPNESYFLNKKIAVYIVEINDEIKGRNIIVSRTHPGLIEGLFKREVPEVAAGSVVIKKVVREPGSRAKIAVYSEQSGVDPVGSCVGQKGVRIQAVIDAIDGLEKIDVIQYSPDAVKFITNALSPAKNITVTIHEKEKIANVSGAREELPLVIGRDGQNVRLASMLTEYNIEVQGSREPALSDAPIPQTGDVEDISVSDKASEKKATSDSDKKVEEKKAKKTTKKVKESTKTSDKAPNKDTEEKK